MTISKETINATSYQARVAAAHHALFHDDPTDVAERLARFFEEVNETCQAFGMSREDAHKLVDYTYDRPVGEPAKEIGAAMLTLASLSVVAGLDLAACAEADLEKLQRPETIARIRAKRSTRHGRGPLPGFDPSSPGKDGGQEVEAVSRPVICIGRHTIDRLVAGHDVEIDAAIMIPASDLSAEPICHLVWRQGRISIDDVEDYYEVARRGDKSVDGSDPFPVFLQPASTALVEAARFLADRLEDFRQKIDDIDDEREFEGHIIPALARLRSALSASTSREGESR